MLRYDCDVEETDADVLTTALREMPENQTVLTWTLRTVHSSGAAIYGFIRRETTERFVIFAPV